MSVTMMPNFGLGEPETTTKGKTKKVVFVNGG